MLQGYVPESSLNGPRPQRRLDDHDREEKEHVGRPVIEHRVKNQYVGYFPI